VTHPGKFILLACLVWALISSCSGGSQSGANTSRFDTTLSKGTIIDSVHYPGGDNLSYALYLPATYTPSKQYPCIFFFDSHGNGSMPLRKYHTLAGKYGFIMLGSNNSRNGLQWPTTNDIVQKMMADARSRLNIDTTRIYTSGFSGGAKVASSVALLSGGVAGVIACSGGFPPSRQQITSKFDVFCTVGDSDFNLSGLQAQDEQLAQIGFSHQLLTFHGKHHWPSANDFNTAMMWMQANAMKHQLQPKNDSILAQLSADFETRIATAITEKDILEEHLLLTGLISVLGDAPAADTRKKQLADIDNSPEYLKAVEIQADLQSREGKLQQELNQEFSQKDEKWWAARIAELNADIKNASSPAEAKMYTRVVNYLGLIGFMTVSRALSLGDLESAASFLKTFKLADPQNPDCPYLAAEYYLKMDKIPEAMKSLNEAVALGYCEPAMLITNPAFNGIRQNPEFQQIFNAVVANSKKDE